MRVFVLSLFFTLCSSGVSAAPEWCYGTIKRAYLTSDGSLIIRGSWANDYTQICNLNAAWKGVSVGTCKGWLSLAMAAKLSSSNVIVYYLNISSCDAIPHYGLAPSPNYLMLNE